LSSSAISFSKTRSGIPALSFASAIHRSRIILKVRPFARPVRGSFGTIKPMRRGREPRPEVRYWPGLK
jgi:hypothetical protein